MRLVLLFSPLAAAVLAFAVSPSIAADDIRTERVHFKPGTSGATIDGKIKGYETVDYVLEAAAGQKMTVSMTTDNPSSYFNILAPGETEAAMFIGSTSGNEYQGTLPANGDYRIRVYMMRNAARRKEVANYRLEMVVTGAASKANAAPPAAAERGAATPANLKGMDAIKAIDEMTALGFTNVDTITSGETIYGIYYNRSTKQCIQLTNADDEVYAVNDIKTHPKCR